ncbi:hypothetical protein FACS18945_6140 [Bacteroidia bacterium]|nr:hypothetical protein FACS18945_6140 [Bacteroidia bacterium]
MTATVSAQEYVGNYSGTLTLTPTVFTIDEISNVNTEIQSQTLEVTAHWILFPAIPFFKVGYPADIGFIDVVFAPDGSITAPPIDGGYESLPITFTLVSGSVSGNTITLAFRMVDKSTNGTLLDATVNYTGVKLSPTDINDVSADKTVSGYYSLTGKKLTAPPANGVYIIQYDNGTTAKVVK